MAFLIDVLAAAALLFRGVLSAGPVARLHHGRMIRVRIERNRSRRLSSRDGRRGDQSHHFNSP
jgi:hypothetical protein